MERLEQFFDLIRTQAAAFLATAAGNSVTMRAVSPVPYGAGVLIGTDGDSRTYRQLRGNPHCCLGAERWFAECDVLFLGQMTAPENQALRAAYAAKYPGAFEAGSRFDRGRPEFVLLLPIELTGWEAGPDGAQTPFSLTLKQAHPAG